MLDNAVSSVLPCSMSMLDLDLRQLQYFLKVAETLNISQAARELGMTQPALSRQVRAFEDSLESPLLDRGKRSIALTRAGEAMVTEGETIMRSVTMGLKRFRSEVEGVELRIGFAPSLAIGLIEGALACFSRHYPGVRVSWFDLSTQEMWQGLKREELDLILEIENDDPAIHWQPISEKPIRMAVPTQHPLAERPFLTPKQIHGERLLLLSRHEYPVYWSQVTTYFNYHQIDAKIVGEFDGNSSLKMGIDAGLGMAFVAGTPPGLHTIELKPKPEPLRIAIGFLKRKKLAKWEQAFIDSMYTAG